MKIYRAVSNPCIAHEAAGSVEHDGVHLQCQHTGSRNRPVSESETSLLYRESRPVREAQ